MTHGLGLDHLPCTHNSLTLFHYLFRSQAVALAGQGDFHQALAFVNLLPGEEEKVVEEGASGRRDEPGASSGRGDAEGGGGGRDTHQRADVGLPSSSDSDGHPGSERPPPPPIPPPPPPPSDRSGHASRAVLEQRLRLMYGHHLFSAGHHDEGMAQLAMSSGTCPLLLLRWVGDLFVPPLSWYH